MRGAMRAESALYAQQHRSRTVSSSKPPVVAPQAMISRSQVSITNVTRTTRFTLAPRQTIEVERPLSINLYFPFGSNYMKFVDVINWPKQALAISYELVNAMAHWAVKFST